MAELWEEAASRVVNAWNGGGLTPQDLIDLIKAEAAGLVDSKLIKEMSPITGGADLPD